jgi:cell division protein FtsB
MAPTRLTELEAENAELRARVAALSAEAAELRAERDRMRRVCDLSPSLSGTAPKS